MSETLKYFEEMKKCNQLDYGKEKQKCSAIEDDLIFANFVKSIMSKYEIETVEQLEAIIKDYDEMAKDIVEMATGRKVDIKQ